MENKKVIHIDFSKKPHSIISTLEELMDDLKNDKVSDFIVISRAKEHVPDETFDGHVVKYNWMGRTSSIQCLGLCDYMASKIKDWIWNRE